jgi:hypothetical protein
MRQRRAGLGRVPRKERRRILPRRGDGPGDRWARRDRSRKCKMRGVKNQVLQQEDCGGPQAQAGLRPMCIPRRAGGGDLIDYIKGRWLMVLTAVG